MNAAPERKYVLTKIAAGDYLLPSNDGKTIWRIARYADGPSHGLDDMPKDREFWGVWRWTRSLHFAGAVDTQDWSGWEFCEGFHETRSDAIKAALR